MLRAAILAACLAAPTGVAAQVPCVPYGTMAQTLWMKYAEVKVASFLSNTGNITEVWVNPETGTATVIGITPEGHTCILDTGEGAQLEILNVMSERT